MKKIENWGGVVADPPSQHHSLLSEPVAAILIILSFFGFTRQVYNFTKI